MASSVATPLERQFGRIAGVNQMTSSSSLGSSSVTLQFDVDRDIDAAARDVQAAINAARNQLPAYLPQNPGYRKANPAEAPILILTLTSDVVPKPQIYDMADSILAQKIAQIQGVGQVFVGGSAQPAVRVELNPMQLGNNGVGLEAVRTALSAPTPIVPRAASATASIAGRSTTTTRFSRLPTLRPSLSAITSRPELPVRVGDLGTVVDSVSDIHTAAIRRQQHPGHSGETQRRDSNHHLQNSRRQRHRHCRRRHQRDAAPPGRDPAYDQDERGRGPHHHDSLQRSRRRNLAHHQRSSRRARCLPLPARGLGHHHSHPSPCRFLSSAPSA